MRLINKFVEKQVFHEFLEDFSSLGSPLVHIIITLVTLFLDFTLFKKLAISLVVANVTLIVLRSIYFSKRPKGKNYKTLIGKIDNNSRFSAHSASSFVLAIIIGLHTSQTLLGVLFCLSILIAISRISLKKHFVKDVVIGSVLGIILGILLSSLL